MPINPPAQAQSKKPRPNAGTAPDEGMPRRVPPQAGGPQRVAPQSPASGMMSQAGSKALRNFLLAGGVTGGSVGLGLWIF